MRVLLIIESPKRRRVYFQSIQPLGVLYIASYLESKGIHVDVKDFNVERRRPLKYNQYNAIAFSMNSGNVERTMDHIDLLKKRVPNIDIVLGGSHVKLIANQLIINDNIDCVIEDEDENILYNYIINKNKEKVKGIWIKKKGKPYFTGRKKPIENLDVLPFPAFKKVPYKKYNVIIKKHKPVCAIITSRGCPHGCIFCYHSLSYKYRARSPENVLKEIIWLKSLGINEIWIADDSFTEDMVRAEKICDLIIEKGIKISITLSNGVRADRLNEKLLRKLKRAGCWFLTVAPEVGNPSSLKKIKKGFKHEDVIRVVNLCKKIGIRTMSNFVIGFPWESEKEIKETLAFSKKLDTDISNVCRLIPYPHTPLWNMVDQGEYTLIDEKISFKDARFKHSKLSEQQIRKFIKQFNRSFYTPKKILNIAMMLKPEDFIQLVRYSLLSGIM